MERVSNVSVRAPADCKTLMFIRGGDRLFSGLNSGEAFSPRTCRSIRILWQRFCWLQSGRQLIEFLLLDKLACCAQATHLGHVALDVKNDACMTDAFGSAKTSFFSKALRCCWVLDFPFPL